MDTFRTLASAACPLIGVFFSKPPPLEYTYTMYMYIREGSLVKKKFTGNPSQGTRETLLEKGARFPTLPKLEARGTKLRPPRGAGRLERRIREEDAFRSFPPVNDGICCWS